MTNKTFCVKQISCILEKSLLFIFYEVFGSFDRTGRGEGPWLCATRLLRFVVGVPDA